MRIFKAKRDYFPRIGKPIEHIEVRIYKNGGITFNPYGFGYDPNKLYDGKIKFTDYYVLFYKTDLKKRPKPDLFKGVVEIKDAGGFLGKCSFITNFPEEALIGAEEKARKRFYCITDTYIGAVYFKNWKKAIAFLFWYLKQYKKEEFKYPELYLKYKNGYYIVGTYIKELEIFS